MSIIWRLPFVVVWETFFLACLAVFLILTYPLAYCRSIRIPTPFGALRFQPIEMSKRYSILMHLHLFALLCPSQIVFTLGDGKGNIIDPARYTTKDENGQLCSIDLPRRAVWISNHQLYTDWLYLWSLAYYSDLSCRVFIVLKNSLRRIPVFGSAMEPARFILLARNWEQDQHTMRDTLNAIANESGDAFSVLIYPEGTNLDHNTQKKSLEFAQKHGLPSFYKTLSPRSTGLCCCIETLAEAVPDLHILVRFISNQDFTVAYSDVSGFASECYPGGKRYLISISTSYWQNSLPNTCSL